MGNAVPPTMQTAAVTREKGQGQPSFPYVVSVRQVDGSSKKQSPERICEIS